VNFKAQYFVVYFDRNDNNRPLISRKIFENKQEAKHHAKTISKSWNPMVVVTVEPTRKQLEELTRLTEKFGGYDKEASELEEEQYHEQCDHYLKYGK